MKTQNQGETPDCSSQKDEVADKTIKEDKADVFENVCDVKSSTNTTDNNDSDATVSADEGGIGDDMFTSNSDSQFMSIKSTERAMQRANDTRRGSIKPVSLPDCQALEQTSAKKTEPIVGSLTISSSSSIPTSYRKPKSDIASRVEREIEESRRLGAEVNKPIEVKTEMPSPIIIAPPKRLTEIEQPTVVAANDLNKSLSTSMTDSAEVTVLKTITKSPVTMPQRPPPLIRTPQESPHTNQPTTATNPLPNRMENAGIQKIPAGSITQGTPVRPPPPPSPLQLLTAQGGIMGRSPLSQPSPQSSGLLRSFQDPNMLMRPPTPAGTPISREEFLSRQPFMLEHMGREERPDMQGSSQQALISAAIFERHLNNARLEYMTAKQMGLSDEQAWMRYQQVLAVPAEIHSQQMLAEAAARQQDSNKQILADFLIAQQIQQHAEANKREREVASVQHQLQQQQQNQQSAIGDLARLGLDMSRLDSTLQAGLLSHHIYEQQQLEHRQQLLKQHQAIEQQRLIEQQQQRLLADRRVMEQRAVEAHMAVERQKAAAEQQRLTEYTRQLQQQQRMAAASNQLLSHGYLDPKLRLTANDILMRGELERNLSSLSRSPLQQYHQMGTHFLPAAQSPLPRNVMSTAAAGGHRFASTPPQPTPSPKNPLFDRTRVSPVILSPTAGGLSARGEHQLPLSQSQTPPAQLRTKGAMKMVTTKETQPVLSSLTEAQIKEYLNRPASPHTLSLPKGFEPRSAAGSLHHTQLHPSTSVNSPKTSAPPQSLVKAEAKQISRAESTLKVASPAQSAPAPTGVGHKAEVKSQIDGWLNDFIRRETAEPSGRIPSVVESLKERPETTSESSADKSCLSGLGKHIDDIIAEGFKSHQISASIQQQTTSVLTTSAGTAAPEKERKPTPPAFVYEFEPVSPPDGENVGEQSDVQQQTTPAWVAGAAKMNILRPDAGGSTAGTSPFQSAINVFDLKSPVRIQSGSQAANYPTTPGR